MSDSFKESFKNWLNATGDVSVKAFTVTKDATVSAVSSVKEYVTSDKNKEEKIQLIMEIQSCDRATAEKLYEDHKKKVEDDAAALKAKADTDSKNETRNIISDKLK
jgi:hypothetical protein